MDQAIIEYIKQRKATFFIGAGISMIPPSCLPSWWQVNHIILDSLAEESYSLIPDVKDLVGFIKAREEDGKLPPEFVSEIITDRIGKSYFDVLKGLEGDTPNQAHLWLATLAKAGLLKAIITTNFDTLVERAFEIVGTNLKVLVDPNDYEDWYCDQLRKADSEGCVLFKLHGTATRPDTCIDTLAQRKQGLSPSIEKALDLLGTQTYWIFLGYSGGDLDAEPNYLGVRARKKKSPGFAWLHLPNTSPLKAVEDLSEFYGMKRGIIEYGTLPDWLDPIDKVLPIEIDPPEKLILLQEEVEKIRSEKLEKVKSYSRNWAKSRGTAECALILTDITSKAGSQESSQKILLKMLENIGDYTPFGLGLINQELTDLFAYFGKNKEALKFYRNAVKHYREIEHVDGINASLQGIAVIEMNFGNFSKAEEAIKDYLEYDEKNDDHESNIHGLLDLGSLYRETGRYSEALETYREVIHLTIEHGLEVLRGHATLGTGLIENTLGKPEEAEEKVREAMTIYTRLGNDGFLSESLRELTQINFKRGDVDSAFKILEDAKEKAILVGNKSRIIRTDWIFGEFLSQLGNYSDAVELLKNASFQAEELKDITLLISVLQSLGLSLQNLGHIEESYQIYLKALNKAKELGLELKAAGLHNNMGILLEQSGDLDNALKNYLAADAVFKRTGQLEAIAGSQGNIANINYRLGNFEEAKRNYQKTLQVFENLQDIGGILRTQFNLANVIYQTGDIDQAKASYIQAINLAKQYEQHGLKDVFQLNYAGVLFGLEDYSAAIELYSDTYKSSQERKDYNQAGTSSYYAGIAHMKLDNFQKAYEAIKEAILVWEKLEEEPSQVQEAKQSLESLKAHLEQ